MSHNGRPYYTDQTTGPGWQQPGYSGPPQNRGPQFSPQNQNPLYPHQNLGSPSFAAQNQGPQFTPQNQSSDYPIQNPGTSHPPQNQSSLFPTQNQGPPFPPQNRGPFCPTQNQGPSFPPLNQGTQFPPQNPRTQFHPQNQGPLCPSQNQVSPFSPQIQGPPIPPNLAPLLPPQNQGPLYPSQNQQPQFPPQNRGDPIQQQNQIPLCPPQNQAHVFPPQNQGLLYPQNQGLPGPPQNQGCPILNPSPPIPPQNQGPPFHHQNQRPLCSQNRGPRFPPRNQDPCFPQNNEPSYAPRDRGPAYTHSHGKVHHSDQQHDNWESSDAYTEDEECCDSQYEDYGDDWSNQNNDDYEDDWANQNEDDWNSQTHNRNKKIAFKRSGPSTRGLGKYFLKNDLIEKDCKKTPLIKIPHKGPTKNPYQSTSNNQSSSNKQCSNNIQVNIVKSSDLDCWKPPQTSKLKTKHLVSSMNESTQTCPLFKQTALESSEQYKKQEADVCTKSIRGKFNLKSNENSTQKRDEQFQKTNPAQAKEMDSKIKNTNKDASATSNLRNDNSQSKSIQKVSTQSLDQGNQQDNVVFKSNRGKCDAKSNEKAKQSKDKPIQKLNKSHDKGIENSLKKDAVLTSNHQKDYKQSQVNQNIFTESAKQVKKLDYVHLNLNDTCTAKPSTMLLQYNNDQSLKTKKAQVKEVQLENANGDPSSTLNQQKSSPSNNLVKSKKTSNFQREKLKSSKRLHPQDGNSSINTKKIRICDKLLSKEEPHSPSKVLATDSNPKSKPEIQDKIKGTSLSQDRVEINERTFDQTSLSQPTDKLNRNPKINIENTNGEKRNQTENLPQLKETTCIPNKITTNNTDVNQTSNMSQLTNETAVKSGEENPYQALNIQTEPDDSIMKASVKNEDITNSVTSKEALTNEIIDHPETNSNILVQNNTNSSEVNSISPDSFGNIYSEQLHSICNESTPDDKSQNSELSGDGINPLEANLREFDILDEVGGSDDDEGGHSTVASEGSDSEASEQVSDVGIEDIDAMLEEGLSANQKGTENKAQKKVIHKVVLEEIGHDHFDSLPEGWIKIIHDSGMPVYLHESTRECTLSRPYFLGPGSARNHKVPLSAVPCMQYKQALEVEKKHERENRGKQTTDSEQTNENRQPLMPLISARIETAEENEAAQSIDPTELQEYCKNVFNFKTVSIIPFKSWGDRRKFARMTKDLKKQQRPLLPSGTKLLKFPIQNPDGTISKSKGEWVINPNGKSYVCILHEYVQHALKQHPKYQFKELKNPATPYSATVYIGEMQYGTGMGGSKKHAKVEAAKAALEVLIPEMKDKIERDSEFEMRSGIAKRSQNYENSIFDQIHIEDPRVAEFCAKTSEPPPYAILVTCLQRNGIGLDEIKVEYNMNTKRHKEDEFKMTVRNHTATVLCKNKRDGKQKAAQAVLKALHPNIEHFGSLLRMYGNHSIKSVKEKKQEEQQITGLQSKATVNQPNQAILKKLREEMSKLNAKRKEQQAKGMFLCHRDLLLPGVSTTDLN